MSSSLPSCVFAAVFSLGAIASGCIDEAGPEVGSAGSGGDAKDGDPLDDASLTTATSSSSSTGGVGGGCPGLEEKYLEALYDALACVESSVDPCTGPTVHNRCGCLVRINASAADEASTVERRYKHWVGAACGPDDCSPPCGDVATSYCGTPPDSSQGHCNTQ